MKLLTLCKSKIYEATVTETKLHYEGSITIDEKLMQKAGILPYEKVQVLNLNSGSRLETFAIKGKKDSGVVCLNGAAAKLNNVGDKVLIIAYVAADEKEANKIKPKLVKVDKKNRAV